MHNGRVDQWVKAGVWMETDMRRFAHFRRCLCSTSMLLGLSDGLTKTPLLPLPLASTLARISLEEPNNLYLTPAAVIKGILEQAHLELSASSGLYSTWS